MKHPAIPSNLTPENLAEWIKSNAAEVIEHVEKTELEEEQVHELEKKSSLASRAIDRLETIKKEFMETLKEGTPDEEMPVDITIPPTKGLKILKANRAFADKQLENGFLEENIPLYMIPYPEDSLMVAFDIEGNEWPEFTKEMTTEQINKHKPMLKKDKKREKAKNQTSFLSEEEEEDDQPIELDL